MIQERADIDTRQENRRLKKAIETLLEEIESSGKTDTDRVRGELNQGRGPAPPWEREGYESKQEWLADKRGGQS